MSRASGRKPRSYQLVRRADAVDQTRRRIVEATVAMHGSVGPAATTVLGIAELAGVTRATVYRHFPDELSLFDACSAHWLAQQVPPHPAAWLAWDHPIERMQFGLTDLYRFYRAGESMLYRIHRDKAVIPDRTRNRLEEQETQMAGILLAAFPAKWRRRRRLRAAIGHAVAFGTWRSLCVDQRLPDDDAVGLMVVLAERAFDPSSVQDLGSH